jgi:hypothetical protein
MTDGTTAGLDLRAFVVAWCVAALGVGAGYLLVEGIGEKHVDRVIDVTRQLFGIALLVMTGKESTRPMRGGVSTMGAPQLAVTGGAGVAAGVALLLL